MHPLVVGIAMENHIESQFYHYVNHFFYYLELYGPWLP